MAISIGYNFTTWWNLSDRQAADAVRSRIDWQYLLGLPIDYVEFDYSILCEFRQRLIDKGATENLLNIILQKLASLGLLKNKTTQRTDSTHVHAAIRTLNRLELVGETMWSALNSLAIVAPSVIQNLSPEHWYKKYSHRVANYKLPNIEAKKIDYALSVSYRRI